MTKKNQECEIDREDLDTKPTNAEIWERLFAPQEEQRTHLTDCYRGALARLEAEPRHDEESRRFFRRHVEIMLARFDYERYLEPLLRRAHAFDRPVRVKGGHQGMSVSSSVLAVPARLRRRLAEVILREARTVRPGAFRENEYLWNAVGLARALGLQVYYTTGNDRTARTTGAGEIHIPRYEDKRDERATILCLIAANQLARFGLAYTAGDQELLGAELAMGRYFHESSAVKFFPQSFVGGWRRHLRNLRVRRHWYTFRKTKDSAIVDGEPSVDIDASDNEKQAAIFSHGISAGSVGGGAQAS